MNKEGAGVADTVNFFDSILEVLDHIDTVENDTAVTKQDLVDSMRERMCHLVPKILMRTNFSATSVSGWGVDTLA